MEREAPRPVRHQDHLAFWEGTQAGELRVQECADCGVVRWPPRIVCGECLSTSATWVLAPTTGTLFSWTVVHHTVLPGFRDDLPYVVGLVELPVPRGTVRMLGGVMGSEPDQLSIGQMVRATFDHDADATLVNWEVQPPREGRNADAG